MEPSPAAPARLSPRISWLYAIGWLFLMADNHVAQVIGDPLELLSDPPRVGARVADRDIAIARGDAGRWPAALDRELHSSVEEAFGAAVDIHLDLESWAREYAPGEVDAARRRATLLLAEAGWWDDAVDALSGHPEEGSALAALHGRLPRGTPEPAAAARAVSTLAGAALAWEPEGWLAQRVQVRLLQLADEHSTADDIEAALDARSRRLRRASERVWLAHAAAAGAGLLIAGAAAFRSGWRRSSAAGAVPAAARPGPAWRLADGLGVWIRADFWNRAVYTAVARMPDAWIEEPWGQSLQQGAAVLAALPLVYLCARHLWSGAERDPWGLAPSPTRWPALAAIAIAALGIDVLGANLLGWLTWSAGGQTHWSEGFDEALVFGTRWQVLGSSLDYLLWTPAAEELSFRGVLYLSLRRRLPAPAAALVSSVFFASLHFYALSGFLATLWSGLVWAGATERARSLWPAFAAHGAYNALYVLHQLSLYR